jgi:hypothetical protein
MLISSGLHLEVEVDTLLADAGTGGDVAAFDGGTDDAKEPPEP